MFKLDRKNFIKVIKENSQDFERFSEMRDNILLKENKDINK